MAPSSPPPPEFEQYRQGFRDGWEQAQRLLLSSPVPAPFAAVPPQPGTPTNVKGVVIPPEWIPLRHIGNGGNPTAPAPCGEISHYLTGKVAWGEKVSTEKMRKLDGTEPQTTERPVCGHCAEPINPWSGSFLDYTGAFIEETLPRQEDTPTKRPNDQTPHEIVQALEKLEFDLMAASKPPPAPGICVRCGEPSHTGACPVLFLDGDPS